MFSLFDLKLNPVKQFRLLILLENLRLLFSASEVVAKKPFTGEA